jgi:hypothetical protein
MSRKHEHIPISKQLKHQTYSFTFLCSWQINALRLRKHVVARRIFPLIHARVLAALRLDLRSFRLQSPVTCIYGILSRSLSLIIFRSLSVIVQNSEEWFHVLGAGVCIFCAAWEIGHEITFFVFSVLRVCGAGAGSVGVEHVLRDEG